MSTPIRQLYGHVRLPVEDFPFPSLSFGKRASVPSSEIAKALAVSTEDVTRLISAELLETAHYTSAENPAVTIESLKRFLIRRLVGCYAASGFRAPISHAELVLIHSDLAKARGEQWNYQEEASMPKGRQPYFPTVLAISTAAALTVDQSCDMLMMLGRDELLRADNAWGFLESAVDLRLPGAPEPLYRVPVETYCYWVRSWLRGAHRMQFLSRQPEDNQKAIFAELGEYIRATPKH